MNVSMATEIEAKFVIPDAGFFRRLKTRRWLAGCRLGERKICRVLDTYLDTKERLLMRAGMAFRVRRQDDGQVWLTLKEMRPATGAVHRREELELLLPAGESASKRILAARALPEGPVRDRLHQVLGRKRLIRLATVRQRRTIRPVAQDGDTVALLSLDAVRVRAGGAVGRFSEVEVEVELTGHGGDGDLDRLATCLEREWGLRPEVCSKLERALAAIDAGSKTPAARKGLGIDPADSMAEAARRVLAFHRAAAIIDALASLDVKYPVVGPEKLKELAAAKRALLAEK